MKQKNDRLHGGNGHWGIVPKEIQFTLYIILDSFGFVNKIEVKPIFGLDNMANFSTAEGLWEDLEGQRFPVM